MLPIELKEKIEKINKQDRVVLSLLKQDCIAQLYSHLYNDYMKSQSIPNDIVLKYLCKKDFASNMELKNDITNLYNLAKLNKQKCQIFLEFEEFYKEEEINHL